MKFLGTFISILFFSNTIQAQVTHAFSFQVGVTETAYLSQIKDSKTYFSHLLPIFAIDYARYNDYAFWGSLGYGFSPRKMTLYKDEFKNRYGIEYPEFWFRIRAGLKFQGETTTHLPHIGLGIFLADEVEDFTQFRLQGVTTYSNQNGNASLQVQRYSPYVELGNTIIHSNFREKNFNMFLSMGIRYYPIPLFKKPLHYEIGFQEYKEIQNNLIELFISVGGQKNIQRY